MFVWIIMMATAWASSLSDGWFLLNMGDDSGARQVAIEFLTKNSDDLAAHDLYLTLLASAFVISS